MKRTILLVVACVAVIFSVTQAQAEYIRIYDNFTDSASGWKVGGTKTTSQIVNATHAQGSFTYQRPHWTFSSGTHYHTETITRTYISATDGHTGTYDYSRFIAPDSYLGDITKLDGGDLKFAFVAVNKSVNRSLGRVVIEGNGLSVNADFIPGTPSQGTWEGFQNDFTATTFGTDPTTWSSILADVTNIELWVDYTSGTGETAGLDNFELSNFHIPPVENSPEVTATPEPTSLAIFGIGACCMGLGAARRRSKKATP